MAAPRRRAGFCAPAATYDFVVTNGVPGDYNDGELYDYRLALERGILTVPPGETIQDVASRYLAGQAAKTRINTNRVEMLVYPVGVGVQARSVQAGYGSYGNRRAEWREPPSLCRISVTQATAASAALTVTGRDPVFPEAPAAAPSARDPGRAPGAPARSSAAPHSPRSRPPIL